ncbi:phosphotransferase enzyme family protein [Fervidibacillus albus]|uniref:Phosphotransferase n=1 Tax=Fervidibacillus albus TaxID=2980026 RepID=A0A9E8RV07_9BACI|nr:phosphotransferase [Fervidibacillus albus]WAA08819.1 phosphotransferase [Fervidibacillus albus]
MELTNFKNKLFKTVELSYSINLKKIVKFGRGERVRWILEADSGEKYFLKEKPYYLKPKKFLSILPFYLTFPKSSVQTPPICLTVDNDFHIEVDGRYFFLLQWINGASLNPKNKNDLIELGELAAKIHSSSIEQKRNWNYPECRLTHFPDVRPAGIDKMVQILTSYGYENKVLSNLVWEWRLLLQKEERNVWWEELPAAWIHGDLHHFNILRDSSGNLVLIDLDDVHWGYRLADIAWAIVICLAWEWPSLDTTPFLKESLSQEELQYILQGYEKVTSLTEVEKYALHYFVIAMLVKSVICIQSLIRNTMELGAGEVIKSLQDVLRLLDKWNQ